MRVSPFRHLRIKGYLLLPAAFRSLSRLSSAPSAKAFPLCSFLLDLLVYLYTRNFVASSCVSLTLRLSASAYSASFALLLTLLFSIVDPLNISALRIS